MDFLERLGASWTTMGQIVVATIAVYVAVIVLTRIAGLRSLAKMSSFDFAATVAVGSTVASTALASTPLVNGLVALAMLYGLQYLIATLRRRDLLHGLVDNSPILLMAGEQVLDGNLRHARMSREELWSKLRESGVHSRREVYAVVLETTGDISVLTGDRPVDPEMFRGVRDASLLPGVAA